MTGTILLKRGNTASNDAYTGPLGEVTIDTQKRKLRVQDGVQEGGYEIPHQSEVDAINNKIGQANGIAELDAGGKVPAAQLPAYVDDVQEYSSLGSFPATGASSVIYVALDTNKAYRWSGSAYVYITSGAVDSVNGKTGVVSLAPVDLGLGNVDNTSDINKPVSGPQQTALNNKANKANPVIDGTARVVGTTSKAAGSGTANVFSVEDSNNEGLLEVRENGDVKIGGNLTVSGTGQSNFAGDVNIGGSITVAETASVQADFTGEDLSLTGNLTVNGNTTLGDAAGDQINVVGTLNATIDGGTF